MSLKQLQQKINYTFKSQDLLEQALTHRSHGKNNYERLEFLGDSILGMVIAQELYKKFPTLNEGKLSRFRSRLVKGETLTKIAIELELSQDLILGLGELKSGGINRPSILEDTIEAIFAAVYLDSDFVTVKEVILHVYKKTLNTIKLDDELKDPKSLLQEYLQKYQYQLPIYTLVQTKGKDHDAIFKVSCYLEDKKITVEQEDTSLKAAEQSCAQLILNRLKNET